MHSLKPTGDNIAQEFFKLLNKKANLEDPSMTDEQRDAVAAARELQDRVQSEDPAHDFESMVSLVEDDSASDSSTAHQAIEAAEQLLNEADDSMVSSASDNTIISGLNKIATNLRAKGENFAADVVEATAISINDDAKKEAANRLDVISGLQKIANDFYKDNERLAGDMVSATINKISNFS